jgi:hypothetical protein
VSNDGHLELYYRSLGKFDDANYCAEVEAFADKYGVDHVLIPRRNPPLFRGLVDLGNNFGLFSYGKE